MEDVSMNAGDGEGNNNGGEEQPIKERITKKTKI